MVPRTARGSRHVSRLPLAHRERCPCDRPLFLLAFRRGVSGNWLYYSARTMASKNVAAPSRVRTRQRVTEAALGTNTQTRPSGKCAITACSPFVLCSGRLSQFSVRLDGVSGEGLTYHRLGRGGGGNGVMCHSHEDSGWYCGGPHHTPTDHGVLISQQFLPSPLRYHLVSTPLGQSAGSVVRRSS